MRLVFAFAFVAFAFVTFVCYVATSGVGFVTTSGVDSVGSIASFGVGWSGGVCLNFFVGNNFIIKLLRTSSLAPDNDSKFFWKNWFLF